MTDLGATIRRLRVEHGLSEQDLAEQAGLDDQTITRIETSTNRPHLATLVALAGALGVPISDLDPARGH